MFLFARFPFINISIDETEGLSGWQFCHRWRHGRLTAYNLWGHQRRQGLHREGFRILVVICLYMLYIIATNVLHYLLFTITHVAAVDCRMYPTSNQLYLMSSLSGNRLFEFCIPPNLWYVYKGWAFVSVHSTTPWWLPRLTENCKWYLPSTTVLGDTYDWKYEHFSISTCLKNFTRLFFISLIHQS